MKIQVIFSNKDNERNEIEKIKYLLKDYIIEKNNYLGVEYYSILFDENNDINNIKNILEKNGYHCAKSTSAPLCYVTDYNLITEYLIIG